LPKYKARRRGGEEKQTIQNTMQIIVESNADTDAAIESIIDIYLRIGKKYFEKYNSIKKIQAIFNNEPFQESIADIGGMFAYRCIRGLILSKLCNPSKYQKLVEIYDEEILNTSADFIDEYEKMKSFLELHYP
jgi:hypothetical protein